MAVRLSGRVIAGIVLTLAAAMPFLVPESAAGAGAGFLAAAFLPGAAILLLLFGRGLDSIDSFLYAGALSPFLCALIAVPLLRSGETPHLFIVAAVLFGCLYWIGVVVRRGERGAQPVPRGIILLALALALLVAVPLLVDGVLRVRSDAWFHTAVAERIAQAGVPPDDPFYAGLQLRYFWGYHVFLLVLRSACGGSFFDLMAALNVLFFTLYLLALYTLSRRLSPKGGGAAWAMVLAVFGINLFGGVLLLARAFLGEMSGLGALEGVLRSGAVVVHQNLSYRYLGSLAFFLDKFLVGTPFGMALVLLLCFLGAAIDWLAAKRRGALCMAGLCCAGALFFHTVVGLSILLSAGAAFAGVAIAGRVRPGCCESSSGVSGVIMLAVVVAALSPYLATIISIAGRGGTLPVTVNGGFPWTVCAAGILPIGLVIARLSNRAVSVGELFVYLFIVAAMILGTFARLPFGNANKFVYIVFLPVIALAGGMVPVLYRRLRALGALRPVVLAAVCLCAVTTVSLGIAGSVLDPGVDVPVPVADGAVSPGPAAEAAYRWLAEKTPEDAIMINADRRDVPVLARRRQLWTRSTYAETWGYADESVGWREDLTRALYAGRPVPVETWMKLLALGSPVYLIVRPDDTAGAAEGGSIRDLERYREIFANEEFSIFEILPGFE